MQNIEKIASRLAITATNTTKRLSHSSPSKNFSSFMKDRLCCIYVSHVFRDIPCVRNLYSATNPQILPDALFSRPDRPRPAPQRKHHGTRNRGIVRMEVDDEILSGLDQVGVFYAIAIGGEDQRPPQGIGV